MTLLSRASRYCVSFFFVIAWLLACKTPQNMRFPDREGWLGPKYYQIKATGQANPGSIGYARRRAQARAAALKNAYKALRARFFDDKILKYCKTSQSKSLLCRRVRLLDDIIEKGTIVKSSFAENDDCTINYQLFAKDLKSAVERIEKSAGTSNSDEQDKPAEEEKPPSLFDETPPGDNKSNLERKQ